MRIPFLAVLVALVLVPSVAGAPATRAKRPAAKVAPRHVLPFIADDYAKALAQAKARKLPIFIESWAPW